MTRAMIWLFAFSPTIIFLFVPKDMTWAGLSTLIAGFQGPCLAIAAIAEYVLQKRRNPNAKATSKAGNALAIFLGLSIGVFSIFIGTFQSCS